MNHPANINGTNAAPKGAATAPTERRTWCVRFYRSTCFEMMVQADDECSAIDAVEAHYLGTSSIPENDIVEPLRTDSFCAFEDPSAEEVGS